MTKNIKPYNNDDWYTEWYNRMQKISAVEASLDKTLSEEEMHRTEKAMSGMQDMPRIWESMLGWHSYVRKNYPQAVKHLTAAIEDSAQQEMPGAGWSNYFMRGQAYAAQGDDSAALVDYDHVIDVMAQQTLIMEIHRVVLARSQAHHNLGNYPAAVKDLERAIAGNGKYRSLAFALDRTLNEDATKTALNP